MSRPKKTGHPGNFKEEFCQMLIDHMAEGFTFESFAGVVGCCEKTLYNWLRDHPSFLQSKNVARPKQRLANEKMMHQIAKGKIRNANVTAQIFIMKNCHGWRDKTEVIEVPADKMTLEQAKEEARRIVEGLD